jgi:hypothetical protein
MKRVNEFGYSAEMLDEKNKVTNTGDTPAIEANEASKAPENKKDD